jgi:predicted DNA-binding transcriptional regulator YafY
VAGVVEAIVPEDDVRLKKYFFSNDIFCRLSGLSLLKNRNRMAKIEMLQRLLLIIYKLDWQNSYVPSEELLGYVENNMRIRYGVSGFSLRTLQRDIKTIEELFGILVKHKKEYGYYILERESPLTDKCEELLLNFDILNALSAESGMTKYLFVEHHRPVGSVHLPLLLDAIRNDYFVEFDYTLFRHNNELIHRKVAPHFLKESRQRWYLLAFDEGKLKSFGIERISNLNILDNEHFVRNNAIDVANLFKDCFGIWNQDNIPIEDVILSYNALDGKFLKSVPLHHSQTILLDSDNEFRIKVRLRITNDFVMELLSRSTSLTVIEPLSLKERIRTIYQEAIKRNS